MKQSLDNKAQGAIEYLLIIAAAIVIVVVVVVAVMGVFGSGKGEVTQGSVDFNSVLKDFNNKR